MSNSFKSCVAGSQKKKGRIFIVLRTFRLLRIFRIFKIIRSWTSLRSILSTVALALPNVGNLAFLTFLFVFIYALLGKYFFGQHEPYNDNSPYKLNTTITQYLNTTSTQYYNYIYYYSNGSPAPYRFDTLSQSLISVFILLTSENWNDLAHVVMGAHGKASLVYFVCGLCIGNYLLLNLFLAILLKYISD